MSGLKSLIDSCDLESTPGVEVKVRIICACDVDETAWPAFLPEEAGTPAAYVPGNAVTYDGDIVLKPGKFWKEFTIITETGEIKETQVGVQGSKSWKSTFDFKKSTGNGPAFLDWVTRLSNGCMIVGITEMNGGTKIMGRPGSPVSMPEAVITSGGTIESERNGTMQFSAPRISPFYTGSLPIE